MKLKWWNILSPDGFAISPKDFTSKRDALMFFSEWKLRFKSQGYYSSNKGRISLTELENNCQIIKIKE